jgi:hypothetical protein
MAFVEPTDAFLADFATTVVIGGSSTPAFYDKNYADALGMTGNAPVLLLPTTAVGLAAFGTAVTAGGISYTVAERQDSPPDNPGWTRLVLEAI